MPATMMSGKASRFLPLACRARTWKSCRKSAVASL
jgi:hypothetical protein